MVVFLDHNLNSRLVASLALGSHKPQLVLLAAHRWASSLKLVRVVFLVVNLKAAYLDNLLRRLAVPALLEVEPLVAVSLVVLNSHKVAHLAHQLDQPSAKLKIHRAEPLEVYSVVVVECSSHKRVLVALLEVELSVPHLPVVPSAKHNLNSNLLLEEVLAPSAVNLLQHRAGFSVNNSNLKRRQEPQADFSVKLNLNHKEVFSEDNHKVHSVRNQQAARLVNQL